LRFFSFSVASNQPHPLTNKQNASPNQPSFLQDWHKDLVGANSSVLDKLPLVQCAPMKEILKALNIKHVDVWILDIEGGEMMALRGVDFSIVSFNLIAVECSNYNKEKNIQVVQHLEKNHFECLQFRNTCYCKHSKFKQSQTPFQERNARVFE